MSVMEPHFLSLEPGEHEGIPADGSIHIAQIVPADPKMVRMVLRAKVDSEDGRSQYVWCRLANGDLILGVFPQGETYLATEADPNRP
jgi:hypothetical protein